MMKRTWNNGQASYPRKKLRADGTWEASMVTARIVRIYDKLVHCLINFSPTHDRSGAFLDSLDEVKCTEEEFIEVCQIRTDNGVSMLHRALSGLTFEVNLATDVRVIRKLIEANPSLVLTRNFVGNTPLHIAALENVHVEILKLLLTADPSKSSICAKNQTNDTALHIAASKGAHIDIFKLLLNADPSNLSLLVRGAYCGLPLHTALRTKNNSTDTLRLLYDIGHKKQILDAEDTMGRTPMCRACEIDHSAFTMLAEDRIQLIPGIPSWRGRLRHMVQIYLENKSIKGDRTRQTLKILFCNNFKRTISEFEFLYQVMPLLELAVWKGRGLPNEKQDRKSQWITCGAQQIAPRVAEFLGLDAIGIIQSEVDRMRIPID